MMLYVRVLIQIGTGYCILDPPPLLFEETGCVAVVLSSFWFGRGCIYGGTEALVCVLCPVRSMSGSCMMTAR